MGGRAAHDRHDAMQVLYGGGGFDSGSCQYRAIKGEKRR
jgi:hypothetical protein